MRGPNRNDFQPVSPITVAWPPEQQGPLVPYVVRTAVEARLLLLWRFLQRLPARRGSNLGACRTEDFKLEEDRWRFIYRIDVLAGAAIISGVERLPESPARDEEVVHAAAAHRAS